VKTTYITKALTQAILEHPHDFEWSMQGLGMLRTYLTPELRLHIWDSSFRVQDVSMMHTHPWHFHSYIIAGEVNQFRYVVINEEDEATNFCMRQAIHCGKGGGLVGEPEPVMLRRGPKEVYKEGAIYHQFANEIHISLPLDGTVTLVEREFLDDTEHADVFWPRGGDWVSAEPRNALLHEVDKVTEMALHAWFL
jgi:hypothetical protein